MDYSDGDGTAEPVVFNGGARQFFNFTTGAYLPGSSVWTGAPATSGSGVPGPAPLDYDGDGSLDLTY